MTTDAGWGGAYTPKLVSDQTLAELRDLAGPEPDNGQQWFMVNLFDARAKWPTRRRPAASKRRRAK